MFLLSEVLVHFTSSFRGSVMVRLAPRFGLFLSLSLMGSSLSFPVGAQENLESADRVEAQGPKALSLDDYPAWSRVNQVALSSDGTWMVFAYAPNEGDARTFLMDLRRLDEEPVELGLNGTGPVFSDDSRWLAFITAPGQDEPEGGTRTLHLRALDGADRWEVENPSSFQFSGDGRWLAVHKRRAERGGEGDAPRGADLILRDLQTGSVTNLGNVAEVAFNEASTHLAYLIDAEERAGNGAFVFELDEGRILPVHTGDYLFHGLSWDETGEALTFLRGNEEEGKTHRINQLVTLRGLQSGALNVAGSVQVYDPSQDPAFPEGFVISEFRAPSFSEDGERVYFGIKAQEDVIEEAEDSRADVVVWHWKDKQVQSRQEVQAGRDRRATLLSALNLDADRFVQLAESPNDRIQLAPDGRWAILFDDGPYWMDRNHSANRSDVYRIDPVSGDRALIARSVINSMGISPNAEWFLYWRNQELQAYGLATGDRVNLTEVAGGVDFENKEFDRPVEKPTYGVAAWSADGEYVFLNTRFDVWQLPLGQAQARNLTGGMGDREQIRFRIMDLNQEDDGLDTSEPIVLSAYGERTKKSGYFRARPGRDPQELLFEDAMLGTPGSRGGGLRKARNADRVIFTRQTFVDFPDYWTSDLRFDQPRKVTDANPQQTEFLWGERVLVDYTDQRGNQLQATLTLPADYEEGRRYPMVIYFYEKMSQRHHEYSMPVYDDRPHMSTYASNGYLVLMPDIVYDMGYPGSSALDDVVSAAEATIEAGFADPDRMCLQGHSWGGYESSFIVTQTDMFACVVTGAPLTNLVSMHNILYRQSGSPNASLIEWGQGRMDTTPFHDLDRYIAESPVHNVEGISTPFLILHGTDDGAVDWNQGLEYYIAARRMGKEVILLSYPGEPHHLSRKENQKDFQIRMKQYFDHYLKGAPAPTWMTDGVPFLEKDRLGPKAGGAP